MIRRTGDFLAWLGGANKEILDKVPQERARFVQMAGVLLTTASIAVFSMIFALHNGVKAPLVPAVFLGLVWGVIILNLDRFLVLSMGSDRHKWRLLGLTVPRFALAVVLSLVISTPLVLRIFQSDINQQLFIMREQQSAKNAALEANTSEAQQAKALMTKINTDQAILNGHLPVAVISPQLQADQAQVTKLQAADQSAYQAEVAANETWQCELDGQTCEGASGQAGNGARAKAKQQLYQEAEATYNSAQSQLQAAQNKEKTDEAAFAPKQQNRINQLISSAQKQVPKLQAQYNALEAQLQATAANGAEVNNANTGILAQLQALSEASSRNSSLAGARLAVLALFFLIEMLPVTVKFLLNLGPPSPYEVVAKLKEDEAIDTARAKRVESRRIEERRSEVRINVEDDMRRREEELGKRANEHVTGEMEQILDLALQEWSDRVRAKLAGRPTAPGAAGNGQAGSPGSGTSHQGHPGGGSPGDGSPDGSGQGGGGNPGNGWGPGPQQGPKPPQTVQIDPRFGLPNGGKL
jgi:Domain of unknown function (DUF4407)